LSFLDLYTGIYNIFGEFEPDSEYIAEVGYRKLHEYDNSRKRKYAQANKDKVAARCRSWYQRNKDKLKAKRDAAKTNKDK
jgi:hypothetical protein